MLTDLWVRRYYFGVLNVNFSLLFELPIKARVECRVVLCWTAERLSEVIVRVVIDNRAGLMEKNGYQGKAQCLSHVCFPLFFFMCKRGNKSTFLVKGLLLILA